jgi:pseudaminic acid cytidylyltransferase
MRVAIVPARGGSKRIPRKNIRPFAGRPMIAWTLDALRASGCFDRVLVSTDDDEIAATAAALGAEVPFRRPAALADDLTPTLPVVAHALRCLADAGAPAEFVCCAYPTAPMLEPADLVQGLALLGEGSWDYVFSATTFAFPIQRALRHTAHGGVEPEFHEFIERRSQDLPEVFHDAGQFYWGRAGAFLDGRPIFSPRARPLMLPRHRVQDIDSPEDWARAELLFRTFKDRTP